VYQEVGLEEDEKALRTFLGDAGVVVSAADRPLLSINEILEKLETYRDLVLGYLTEYSSDYRASLAHEHVLSRIDITIDGLGHWTALPDLGGEFEFVEQPDAGDEDRYVSHSVISDFINSEAALTAGVHNLPKQGSPIPQPILVGKTNQITNDDEPEMHDMYETGEYRDARADTSVSTYSQAAPSFEQTDSGYVVPDVVPIPSPHNRYSRNMDAYASNTGQLYQQVSPFQ
jgi:hypothetical protein